MEKYIDYVLQSIINDVNYFSIIYDNYCNLTWIFVWILWLTWIWLKYILLTIPFWLPINMILPKFKQFKKQ